MIVHDKDGYPHEVHHYTLNGEAPPPPPPTVVHVIMRGYPCESGWIPLRAYANKDRADLDIALVADDSGMKYELHTVPFFTGDAK